MNCVKWLFLPILLMGCSSKEVEEDKVTESAETVSEVKSIVLSETDNGAQTVDFDSSDEKVLAIIQDMLNNADKTDGAVNIVDPNYKMIVEREADQRDTYSIWWEDDDSDNLTLMDWEDTHTIYTFEGESARQFEELIK
ncbi:hypothetical protein [Marinilactibacillus kalidii]|uniref:hypothetical protein n=1 Tax=Marinilactibacillus kalidii TaxID=2820274 RepID=UPI001ABDA6D4|nr:hypothetical protein [Marinilactibacillus kalidii]